MLLGNAKKTCEDLKVKVKSVCLSFLFFFFLLSLCFFQGLEGRVQAVQIERPCSLALALALLLLLSC